MPFGQRFAAGQLEGSDLLAFTVCVNPVHHHAYTCRATESEPIGKRVCRLQLLARSLSYDRLPLCENGHTVTITSIPRPLISFTIELGSGQYWGSKCQSPCTFQCTTVALHM